MNEEEKKAIEDMNRFANGIDMSCVTARQMQIILNLIEKLQKENEKLKEERQIVGIPVRNKRDGKIGIVLHQWESGSVAVLENINPRVINTHDSWNTLEIVTDEVKQTQTKCETISVPLVKDKIEELRQKAISYGPFIDKDESFNIESKISILQELLERKNND